MRAEIVSQRKISYDGPSVVFPNTAMSISVGTRTPATQSPAAPDSAKPQ